MFSRFARIRPVTGFATTGLATTRVSMTKRFATTKTAEKSGFSLRKNPYVPYLVLLSLLSSAILKVLSKQQEGTVLSQRAAARRSALQDVLDELETVTDVRELSFYKRGELDLAARVEELTAKKDLDRSLGEIMEMIESAEDEWIETAPGGQDAAGPDMKNAAAESTGNNTVIDSKSSKFL